MVLFHPFKSQMGFGAKESELKGEFGIQGKPGGGNDWTCSCV